MLELSLASLLVGRDTLVGGHTLPHGSILGTESPACPGYGLCRDSL
jgi:hypothetical protein